uniref:Kinesin motor domain-containing protein n=1 Tax=Glossina austeni TaxID=7395 RepID=A0A1A9UTX3_GLOAU
MPIEKNKNLSAEGNIKVICRFRPLSDDEIEDGAESIIKLPNEGEENCISIAAKSYTFDKVLHGDASQDRVYTVAAEPLVSDLLDGYNGTLFAYGQTSSGKTYSMEGIIGDSVEQGIIPRAVNEIFNRIRSKGMEFEFVVKVSYYEIYMEKIHDLLDATKVNLQIHESRKRKPYVKNISERCVSSPEDVFDIIEEGRLNRHVSMTNMNKYSSRSHSVFSIRVNQKDLTHQRQLSGTLYFLDLAGSEKVSKTGANGVVLNEAKIINKSLSALGNVISALSDSKKTHIPYRDSKLTRILQESLGGNARTTVLLCCSPASTSESETKSTLEFGRRAKNVKNAAFIDERCSAEKWKILYERQRWQMHQLENELIRWRNGELVRPSEQIAFADSMYSSSSDIKNSFVDNSMSPISFLSSASNMTYLKESDETLQRTYDLSFLNEQIFDLNSSIDNLKQKLLEKEDIISDLEGENNALKQKLDSTKEDVKALRKAVERLARNYDEKCSEIFTKEEDINELSKKLKYAQNTQNVCRLKMENLNYVKDDINEMMNRFSTGLMEITQSLSAEYPSSDSGTKSTVSLSEIADIEKAMNLNEKFAFLDNNEEFSLKPLDDNLQKIALDEPTGAQEQSLDMKAMKEMLTTIGTEAKQKLRNLSMNDINSVETNDRREVRHDVSPARKLLNIEREVVNEFDRLRQIIAFNERLDRIRHGIVQLESHLTSELRVFYLNMRNVLTTTNANQETKSETFYIEKLEQPESRMKSTDNQNIVHER